MQKIPLEKDLKDINESTVSHSSQLTSPFVHKGISWCKEPLAQVAEAGYFL